VDAGQGNGSAGERAPGRVGQVAAEHRGAADRDRRNAGRTRDRVGHETRQAP